MSLRVSKVEPRQVLVQKKAFADEPAGIVGEVYEKPRGSCGLEESDSGDHINLELFRIIILK